MEWWSNGRKSHLSIPITPPLHYSIRRFGILPRRALILRHSSFVLATRLIQILRVQLTGALGADAVTELRFGMRSDIFLH